MKRVAIICNSLARGGAERVSVHLAIYMKEHGIEPYIITITRYDEEYVLPPNIKRVCLNDSISGKMKLFTLIHKIRDVIKNNDVDVVLIMGVPLCIYAIPGCFGTRAKVVVSERNDPSHFSGKKITKYISRLLMKKADGFVFQTTDAKNYYKDKIKDTGIVIPNPIIVEEMPEPYVGERDKIIVSAGRLNPQKNQKLLIDAFSKIALKNPNYNLIIYGEGSLRNILEKQIETLGLDGRVFLPGNVTDLHERIRKATLFILSSDFEGMPNVLMEAMSLGIPCISTDCPCGGAKELIVDNENGFLVPVNDVEKLSKKIEYILLNDKVALDVSKKAINIRSKFNVQHIGYMWCEYLESIYTNKRKE